MDDRVILHCDCNSFYASVECALNPAYRSVPMAVCGDPESRHGVILAKNELAKAFGGEDESPRFVNGVLGRLARKLEEEPDFAVQCTAQPPAAADAASSSDSATVSCANGADGEAPSVVAEPASGEEAPQSVC